MTKLKIHTCLGLLALIAALLSCGGEQGGQDKIQQNQKEELVKVNRYLVDQDADRIKKYISRRNWTMNTTQTGLWYMIEKHGRGPAAQTGKIATINYKTWLLDGTLCYSSDKLGPKKFRIGKGGVERGLEEGILLLKTGDHAKFIMLPHLAHGLIGDGTQIPARATILYEVELVQISD